MNSFKRNATFGETLLGAVLILLLATVLGLAVHGPRLRQVFQAEPAAMAVVSPVAPAATVTQPTAMRNEPLPVDLADLPALLAAGALLVDARHAEEYLAGHLPGAVSLPVGASDDAIAAFRQTQPPERMLITYCNGYDCQDSYNLALRLIAAGYSHVRVFEGGLPQWRDAGNDLEVGQP